MTTLIAYASKHGSTESIAERIAERLRDAGREVELIHTDELPEDLSRYEDVVLGCPIYATNWHRKGVRAVRERGEVLKAANRLWVFSVGGGPTITQPAVEIARPLAPREHAYLRGALEPAKLGFIERQVIRGAKAKTGDFRDWDAIDAFADRIARNAPLSGPAADATGE